MDVEPLEDLTTGEDQLLEVQGKLAGIESQHRELERQGLNHKNEGEKLQESRNNLLQKKKDYQTDLQSKLNEINPEELEEALKFQLQRLEAFQSVSKNLYSRPLIGRDSFYGGSSEGVKVKYNITYSSSLFDLLRAYSVIIQKDERPSHLTIAYSELYSVDNAIHELG